MWKMVAAVGGVLGATGLLAYFSGRARYNAAMDPTLTPPGTATPLNEVEIGNLAQGLIRIAMNKAALDDATMSNLVGLALKGRLPKTAATIQSIARDGKPGGPSYSPLPNDELWPGSTMNVREYIDFRMKQLKAGVA